MKFFPLLLLLLFLLKNYSCSAVKEPEVSDSISPEYLQNAVYKIGFWTKELNLQTCSIVKVGENYCALFLENLEESKYQEYFLGICQCEILMKWKFCSPELSENRHEDCVFQKPEKEKPSRVHRRFCDLTKISELNNNTCDCSQSFLGKRLVGVDRFPTCYLPLLPKSICEPLDVCGVAKCHTEVLKGGIVKVGCGPKCPGKQPFCERSPLLKSGQHRKVTSEWENWTYPKCNASCGIGSLISLSTCIDRVTKKPALDCLGPGTRCCESDMPDCKCEILSSKNQLILKRTSGTCINQSNCGSTNKPENDY